MVNANSNYLVNKFLYYHDCEMLVNALQNRFNTVQTMLTQVYDILTPDLKHKYLDYDEIIFCINEESEQVNAYINAIIINLASSCDIMTKIAVELSGMASIDFAKYPKMLSANITYGAYKKLPDALKKDGTYFANDRPAAIAKVETIRDEIIHNGSLDFHAQLYYGMKGYDVENWILMPAFKENGNFDSYLGRKKFYDDPERTWNKELPLIIESFLTISHATLQLMLKNFRKVYYENPDDLNKYHKEIFVLTNTFVNVAKKESIK